MSGPLTRCLFVLFLVLSLVSCNDSSSDDDDDMISDGDTDDDDDVLDGDTDDDDDVSDGDEDGDTDDDDDSVDGDEDGDTDDDDDVVDGDEDGDTDDDDDVVDGDVDGDEDGDAEDEEEFDWGDRCIRVNVWQDVEVGDVIQGRSVTQHISMCNVCEEVMAFDPLEPFGADGRCEALLISNVTAGGEAYPDVSRDNLWALLAIELQQNDCLEFDLTFDTTLRDDRPVTLECTVHGSFDDGYAYSVIGHAVSVPYDTVDEEECPSVEGLCYRDGVCYAEGVAYLDNPCEICTLTTSGEDNETVETAWQNAASGTVCNDGNTCSLDDLCKNDGECRGTMRETCPPVVTALSSGDRHNCLLTEGGAVYCWGRNDDAQCGLGNEDMYVYLPAQTQTLASGVSQVRAGEKHSCAILDDGRVQCWGRGENGRLGNNGTDTHTSPVAVSGLPSAAVSIAVGGRHSCAVLDTGAVYCWGDNTQGQAGQADSDEILTATQVSGISDAVEVSAGTSHSCARLQNKTVSCWGSNEHLQLGLMDPDVTRHTPVPIEGLGESIGLSSGAAHTCALLESGKVQCWGKNENGELGNDAIVDSAVPVDVIGIHDAIALGTGASNTCFVRATGLVRCVGSDADDQLGNQGATGDVTFPRDVPTLRSGVKAISVGTHHVCALMDEGGVKCWGSGESGQLARGATSNKPIDIGWE